MTNKKIKLRIADFDHCLDGALVNVFKFEAAQANWTEDEINEVTKEAMSGDHEHCVKVISDHCEEPVNDVEEQANAIANNFSPSPFIGYDGDDYYDDYDDDDVLFDYDDDYYDEDDDGLLDDDYDDDDGLFDYDDEVPLDHVDHPCNHCGRPDTDCETCPNNY